MMIYKFTALLKFTYTLHTDRQTDRQTDALIIILCNCSHRRINKLLTCCACHMLFLRYFVLFTFILWSMLLFSLLTNKL